jgi:CspA family cold shock protein
MGRGRDRGDRRRGFDDDQPDWDGPPQQSFRRAPRQDPAPSGPAVDATVKWFNTGKGFGFVELADGSGDVFLHAAVLEAAGHASVDPGATMSVQVGVGHKGRQVTAVLSVDASSATPERRPMRSARASGGRERHDPATASTIEGSVKWYKSEKGFGFVVGDDGQKDIFLHASVVERAGLGTIGEGQRVSVKVVQTPKGREAISVALLD